MEASVIVSLVNLVGTLLGTFGGIVVSGKLINYRLEQLEKRVEKHNQLIDRTYKLEEEYKLHEEKIKVVNHRIEDLEREDK